jgi:hypothetical protein
MKKLNDEELQRLFEDGYFSSEKPLSDDEKVYATLFEALDREPEGGLPYDFAAKVTRQVRTQQKRNSEWKYNLVAAAIFLGLVAFISGIMAAYGIVNVSTLLKYKWLLILLPIIFIAIQYLDQVLVKARIFRSNSNT